MEVCSCSMFCYTFRYVHSSIAISLMGKRELVALLNLSSWCLLTVEGLFVAMSWGCLRFVIVVFPDHTHLLFLWQKALCQCRHRWWKLDLLFWAHQWVSNKIWATEHNRCPKNVKRSLSAKKVWYAIFFSGEGVAIKVQVEKGKTHHRKVYKDIVL